MKSFKAGIAMVMVLVMAALSFMSCSSNKGKLDSITIAHVNTDNVIVSDIQLMATGTFSNGLALNYTSEVIWSSSNPAVATVGMTTGLTGFVTVMTLTTGETTTITALEPNTHLSGSILLTVVTPSFITITPENPVMAKGRSHQFNAIATFLSPVSGATFTQSLLSSPSLTWISSDTSIATVFKGLVTSVTTTATTINNVNINASYLFSSASVTVTGTTPLIVTPSLVTSITVSPNPATLVSGVTPTQQFTATGNFSDILPLDMTTSVNWTSSATVTATVSNITGSQGIATAVGAGQAFIIATDPISAVTGSAMVVVQ